MCETSISSPSYPRNIIIRIKLVLREFYTICSGHTWRKLLFVCSSLAKVGFNLVLTTRNRRQPSLQKTRHLLTRYIHSIPLSSLDPSLTIWPYLLFYIRVTTKAHAYKLVALRGKIVFFPITKSIEAYIKQFNKTKESVCRRKELNSQRTSLVHQAVFHCFGTPIIMCTRSIQPLLLKQKNSILKWSVIISSTHSFSTCLLFVVTS